MDWVAIASQLGIPAAVLAACMYAIWRVGVWSAKELVVPMRDKHFEVVDSVKAVNERNAETTATIAETLNKISDNQERHIGICSAGKHEDTP